MLVYFIKVLAIQAIFFGFYWFGLRHNISHSLNRIYLLSTLCVSVIIPFIHHPLPDSAQPVFEVTMLEWIAVPLDAKSIPDVTTPDMHFPIWTILKWAYILAVSFLVVRSLFHLYLLKKIKNKSEFVSSNWFSLFKTSHVQPFSFFSNVFIPKPLFGTSAYDQILTHECEHVRQWHSLDRLLVDFFVSLFWFNPFIYLYRNALIEIHEFQADASVIEHFGDPIGYQEILFSQLQPAFTSGLVSHFNFSTIKKRIVMMNKTRNVGYSQLKYALTLPLLAMVLFAFTSREAEQSAEKLVASIESIDRGPSVDGLMPIEQEDRLRPSILPLRTDGKFKVTSTYGMRNDPVSDGKKMHKGLDLSTAVGTEVLATADGEVIEVVSTPDGYGNHIVIKHGDMYQTKYAQLSEFKVKGGDLVKKGDVIGLSGNSGQSTGPHLHYEVYKNGEDVNPMDYIKNYKFAVSKMINESVDQQELKMRDARIAAEMAQVEAEKAKLKSDELLAETIIAREKALEAVLAAEIEEEIAVVARNVDLDRKISVERVAAVAAQEVEIALKKEELTKIKVELVKEKLELTNEEERIRVELKEVVVKEKEEKAKAKEKVKNKEN